MRPTRVALRTFVLLLAAIVAGGTLLAAFHHHPLVGQATPESGDCVVCRLADTKSSVPEAPQLAPNPDAVPDEVVDVAGKVARSRTVPIRSPRAPPA